MTRGRAADARFMRRCLELAARSRGACSPNPMVGAVLVRGGAVIAEGWHRRAGASHAEAAVLARAGSRARGATLFVNLEPCAHFGRTPPCVRAIVEAGVRRVVVAHRDPYPLVRGRGLAYLRREGVRVEVGLLRAEALQLNEAWLTRVLRGRPFVRVKAAMTIDGRIATATGESRWISSRASRALAHRMRSEHDAILVGSRTVLRDDPRLSARGARGMLLRQPLRVVLDSRLRIPASSRVLRSGGSGPGRAIVYALETAPRGRAEALRRAGAEVVMLGVAGTRRGASPSRVPIGTVLADLARRGVTTLLIEGGGEAIASALEAGVVDRIALFIAPILLGGMGVPVVGGKGAARLARAPRVTAISARWVGGDLLLEGRLSGGPK